MAAVLLAGAVAKADVCRALLLEASKSEKFQLAAGRPVRLVLEDSRQLETVFLGKLLRLNGTVKDYAFFSPSMMEIHLIPRERLELVLPSSSTPLTDDAAQPIVRSINQEGPTCAAFSIFNCMRQLHYDGRVGNGKLAVHLAEEQDRTRYLVRVINEYYLDGEHIGAIETLARELGFKINVIPTDDASVFKSELKKQLEAGWPVLLGFDVAESMSQTPYVMLDHKDGATYDRRLWLPRTDHERRQGGHQILVMGAFAADSQEYALVSDPNWSAPRLWKWSEFDKLYSAGMDAWVVFEDGSQPPQPIKRPSELSLNIYSKQ